MDKDQLIQGFLKKEMLLFDEYFRASLQDNNQVIREMVSYIFNTLGKRVRPMLVLMTAKACNGIVPESYHGAVTVELLHTATLIHDDVIDKSDRRRGQLSLNAVYDNTQAVLLGDFLLSTALFESTKTNNFEVIRIISQLGQKLAEGELNQFALAQQMVIDESAYFDVIDKKTASMMRASVAIGAITGGADNNLVKRFTHIGSLLGICFQIRDDIFDYFNGNVGKPTGNDIREGKITLPLIYSLKHAPQNRTDEMIEIIHTRNYSSENIHQLIQFARDYGGIEYAYAKMDDFLLEAEQKISELNLSGQMELMMLHFLSYLKERKY